MIEKEILAQIEVLLQLEYVHIFTGEKPVQQSYVKYSDVISLLNKKRKEIILMKQTKMV